MNKNKPSDNMKDNWAEKSKNEKTSQKKNGELKKNE